MFHQQLPKAPCPLVISNLRAAVQVSIARSAVISLERIVVINVTDKVPGTHGGVVVELLILSNNNSKWEHELTSAQVAGIIDDCC